MSVLVIFSLTSTSWTKTLFGRGAEKAILPSQPVLDQLTRLVEGQEDQVKAMVSGEGMSEVLTMVQHLELPSDARIECNKNFMRCTAEAKGGRNEALIWMRHSVGQSTCKQILDDVNSSSTCKERLVQWGKAKASSRCGAQSSCKFRVYNNKSVGCKLLEVDKEKGDREIGFV